MKFQVSPAPLRWIIQEETSTSRSGTGIPAWKAVPRFSQTRDVRRSDVQTIL